MTIDALATIREEADRLAAVLAAVDPSLQVPTCPGWSADDLLWHLTEVHEFWAMILGSGALSDDDIEAIEQAREPRPDEREALLERRTRATSALLAQLEARGDDEPAWFWFSDERNVGVTRRMQVHEATIHRVDAELTAGLPVTRISDEVAAAGLEHVLQVMWPAGFEWVPDWATTTPVALIEIRPDGGPTHLLGISTWSGTSTSDGRDYHGTVARLLADRSEEGALPQAAVTGSALALSLWAWGREQALEHVAGGADGVGMHGDPKALAELSSLLEEGHN